MFGQDDDEGVGTTSQTICLSDRSQRKTIKNHVQFPYPLTLTHQMLFMDDVCGFDSGFDSGSDSGSDCVQLMFMWF